LQKLPLICKIHPHFNGKFSQTIATAKLAADIFFGSNVYHFKNV